MTYQRFYTLQFVRLWCNDIDNRLILDKYLADLGPMSSRNHLHHKRIVIVTKCQPDKLYRPYFDTDTRFGRLVMARGPRNGVERRTVTRTNDIHSVLTSAFPGDNQFPQKRMESDARTLSLSVEKKVYVVLSGVVETEVTLWIDDGRIIKIILENRYFQKCIAWRFQSLLPCLYKLDTFNQSSEIKFSKTQNGTRNLLRSSRNQHGLWVSNSRFCFIL